MRTDDDLTPNDRPRLYFRGQPATYIPLWYRFLGWLDAQLIARTPRWMVRMWEFIAHDWRRPRRF